MNSNSHKYWSLLVIAAGAGLLLLALLYWPVPEPQFAAGPKAATSTPEAVRLAWQVATSSAEWQPRDSATSFVYQGKLWTAGGLNGSRQVDPAHNVEYWEAPHFNDIWNTSDGVTWQRVTASAAWRPRRSLSVVPFNGELWLFGGWSPIGSYQSDIWRSTDGANWTRAGTAPWPPREGQTTEVWNGKIWMFGGVNYDKRETKNDVWFTTNGTDWQQATGTILWSPRWDHATAVFNNKIYLAGGMNLKKEIFKDVWFTTDGSNWQLATSTPAWSERQGHMLVPYQDKLWLIGRLNDVEAEGVNDVWFSTDGMNWQKTAADPAWRGREDFSALVFNDKIFIFGGMDADWRWRNDVWVSTFE